MLENYAAYQQLVVADPTIWGGAYVDGDALVVKFVGQSAADAQALLAKKGVSRGVRLVESSASEADLQGAVDKADPTLRHDPSAVSWGVDFAASGIAVATMDLPAVAVERLKEVLGESVPLDVTWAARRPSLKSRYYDTIPYYGGNLIRLSGSSSVAWCSTAFNLEGSGDGYSYAVSAGHCYQEGSSGGVRPSVAILRTSGAPSGMGTVWTVSTTASGTMSTRHGDIAIYRLTPISGYANASLTAGTVYVGLGNTSASLPVRSTSELPQNYQSANIRTTGASGYVSGASTGEISPDWISLVNQTVVYDGGFTVKNLTVAEDASECVQHGDSGGAVYLKTSTGASAVGIISGTNFQGAGIQNCRNYYTPVKYIYSGGNIRID